MEILRPVSILNFLSSVSPRCLW